MTVNKNTLHGKRACRVFTSGNVCVNTISHRLQKTSVKWWVELPNAATSQTFGTISTISHLSGLYVKTMRIAGTEKKPQKGAPQLTIGPTSPFSPFSPGGPGKPCEEEEDKHSLEQRQKGREAAPETKLHIKGIRRREHKYIFAAH